MAQKHSKGAQGSRGVSFAGSTSPLAIAGSAFFWLWIDAVVFSGTLYISPTMFYGFEVGFLLVTCVTVILFALFILKPLRGQAFDRHHRSFMFAGAPAGTLGSLMIAWSSSFQNPVLLYTFFILGCILVGFCFVVFTIVWGWIAIVQGHAKALVHVATAWAVSLPFNLLLAVIPALASAILASLLPLFSELVYLVLAGHQKDDESSILLVEPVNFNKTYILEHRSTVAGVDGRLMALALVFCTVFGFMYFFQILSPQLTQEASLGANVAVVGARGVTALGFLIMSFTLMRDHVTALFKTCFVVLVAGLAIIIFGLFIPNLSHLGGIMVAAGYCGFDILVWTMIAFHAYVSDNHPNKTIAVAMLAEQLGILIGALIGVCLSLANIDASTGAVVMMVLNALALIVLVAYTEYGSHLWTQLVKTSKLTDDAFASDHKLTGFADHWQLSQRETEVLAVFVRGRSMAYIADKLYISENTVKSHVRHIYAKCGVHNKQELIDLTEQWITTS